MRDVEQDDKNLLRSWAVLAGFLWVAHLCFSSRFWLRPASMKVGLTQSQGVLCFLFVDSSKRICAIFITIFSIFLLDSHLHIICRVIQVMQLILIIHVLQAMQVIWEMQVNQASQVRQTIQVIQVKWVMEVCNYMRVMLVMLVSQVLQVCLAHLWVDFRFFFYKSDDCTESHVKFVQMKVCKNYAVIHEFRQCFWKENTSAPARKPSSW